jgi:3-mercaptopropionate dioxygenase
MKLLGKQNALEALIDPISRAVKTDRTVTLAGALAGLRQSGAIRPEFFAPPNEQHYVRKLVWRDPRDRFVAVAMTWAPGQGSPLHDHAGLWGVEIVVDGTMCETAFELLERGADGRYRFGPGTGRQCTGGTVGIVAPPREYHDYRNDTTIVAHSFHVYAGDLKTVQTFSECGDGWWTAHSVELGYDA